jgi:hypothetical protein
MTDSQPKQTWLGFFAMGLFALVFLAVFVKMPEIETLESSSSGFSLKASESWLGLAQANSKEQDKTQLWTLQVASFRDRRMATGFRDSLIRDGYEAAVVQTGVEWFAVRTAWAKERDELLKLKQEIEQKYRLQAQTVRAK